MLQGHFVNLQTNHYRVFMLFWMSQHVQYKGPDVRGRSIFLTWFPNHYTILHVSVVHLQGGCFTYFSRVLKIILSKFVYCRNRNYYENLKLKVCTCAQSHALVTKYKISTWNSHHKCKLWHCLFSWDYFGDLAKRARVCVCVCVCVCVWGGGGGVIHYFGFNEHWLKSLVFRVIMGVSAGWI